MAPYAVDLPLCSYFKITLKTIFVYLRSLADHSPSFLVVFSRNTSMFSSIDILSPIKKLAKQ